MKTVKILGTGCPKCKDVEAIVSKTITENNIDAVVIKVEDIMEITEFRIVSTPAVVVDDIVKIYGKVPNSKEVLKALTQ